MLLRLSFYVLISSALNSTQLYSQRFCHYWLFKKDSKESKYYLGILCWAPEADPELMIAKTPGDELIGLNGNPMSTRSR